MRKKSISQITFKSRKIDLKKEMEKSRKSQVRISPKPKTEYILRLHAFTLFPQKYENDHPLDQIKQDINILLKADKIRRNPISKEKEIIENRDLIKQIIRKYKIDIFSSPAFSLLSRKEFGQLILYSIKYELDNWIDDSRQRNFINAKRIVIGRFIAKKVWWKELIKKPPYKEYMKEVNYALTFLSELTEGNFQQSTI